MNYRPPALCLVLTALLLAASGANAAPFSFTTGAPDSRIALASRPSSGGGEEIETGDDFVLATTTAITSATFTGLLTGNVSLADIGLLRAEIYRVFPNDSTNPPSGNVPTRTNSPSDVAFEERETPAELSFSTSLIDANFTANNSILNGIHPIPNQMTGGEGPVTGQEVQFSVNFASPFVLPPDHYFFVPQVEVTGGQFFWLSAAGPAIFNGDLQAWIRNEDLAPDWLRAGTDIVDGPDAPRFNASFSLNGETVPEPGTLTLLGSGLLATGWRSLKTKRRSQRLIRRPTSASDPCSTSRARNARQ